MNMVKVKTSELIGAQLDWIVGSLEGMFQLGGRFRSGDGALFIPSFYWEDGGPIIERERISFELRSANPPEYLAFVNDEDGGQQALGENGPTHLISAMRAYIAHKMGDEVEVPEIKE